MLWALASTLLMGLAGLIVLVFYMRRGQFDDMEDIKYQMFRQDNDPERNK
ncbi:Uncharacterized protein SCG7086_DA_00020 [Chlamydiales bacterium SCGC AG-110-P3]|nr:Uncharacterized protein SCG7086_DA_00020 [Chlamydiales bacterium SCGC AG-110-P3]